jgi:hypothetical protein
LGQGVASTAAIVAERAVAAVSCDAALAFNEALALGVDEVLAGTAEWTARLGWVLETRGRQRRRELSLRRTRPPERPGGRRVPFSTQAV